jgi:glycerophosphoryl diester phosphodiesterase
VNDDGAVAPRIDRLRDSLITFAHRGAKAHARENTIEAFELALRLGARGIETDAWLTADGVAVLDHDGVIGRFGRRRPIRAIERAALPSHIPTIDEFFEALGSDFELSIDLKDVEAAEPVARSIRAVAGSDADVARRVWLCHPDIDRLTSWRDRWPDLRYVHSQRFPRLTTSAEQHAASLAAASVDAMNMHYSDWTGGLTTLFHRFDVLAFGWDAQHERVIEELVDIGIDALYSDHVDRMVAVTDRSAAT